MLIVVMLSVAMVVGGAKLRELYLKGKASTIALLIKVACFVKK